MTRESSGRGPDPTAIGIALAFAGMLILTLTPVAGRWAEIPSGLAVTAIGVAVLLMLAGAAVGLLAGRENSGGGSDHEYEQEDDDRGPPDEEERPPSPV